MKHKYSQTGRYDTFYDAELGAVVIIDRSKGHTIATWNLEPDLSDLAQLVDNEAGELDDLKADEIVYLINMAASVETILEHAPHDLDRYGEVGVSA